MHLINTRNYVIHYIHKVSNILLKLQANESKVNPKPCCKLPGIIYNTKRNALKSVKYKDG
jgi:hypothetical protein